MIRLIRFIVECFYNQWRIYGICGKYGNRKGNFCPTGQSCTWLSVDNQFISYSAYVDDAYASVFRKFVAQLGDEDVQAAGVEETVIAPKVEQDALRADHLITVFAQPFQYFSFAVGEFRLCSGMRELLRDGVEAVVTYLEAGLFRLGSLVEAEGPADECLDAHDQFLHAEGFLQIVVWRPVRSPPPHHGWRSGR